jgi:hypothetical protein
MSGKDVSRSPANLAKEGNTSSQTLNWDEKTREQEQLLSEALENTMQNVILLKAGEHYDHLPAVFSQILAE